MDADGMPGGGTTEATTGDIEATFDSLTVDDDLGKYGRDRAKRSLSISCANPPLNTIKL
jgi:hypothetical protein